MKSDFSTPDKLKLAGSRFSVTKSRTIKAKTPRLKVAIASIITMFAVSAVFITQPIFPEIAGDFKIDMVQARLAFSMASLFYAVAFFLIGPSTDRFNLPTMSFSGLLLLCLTIFLSSYSSSFSCFVVMMGISGFFAALVPASMFPYVVKLAPKEKRGRYLGVIVAASTLGLLIGRVAVGGLTEIWGWKFAFKLVSLLFFLLSLLSLFLCNVETSKKPDRLSVMQLYSGAFKILRRKEILNFYMTGFLIFFGFLGIVTFLTEV